MKQQPISLFKIPNGLNELLEVCFEFLFILLIGKSTMAFLTGQSWHILKSWYPGEGPQQGFWRCFTDGLNQSLVSSVAQAIQKITTCLCFPEQFELVVNSYSAGEISQQPALSNIPVLALNFYIQPCLVSQDDTCWLRCQTHKKLAILNNLWDKKYYNF